MAPTNEKTFRAAIAKGRRHLCHASPELALWIPQCGKCTWEVNWERSIFEALVRAIAHQQLHANAANAILARLIDAFPRREFPSPQQIAKSPVAELRAMGFSMSKVLAIQGIAAAALAKKIPNREQCEKMSDEDIVEALTPQRGVGRWTVEMLLIFTLGRMDVMPTDDYGVRSGLMHLMRLAELPRKKGVFADYTDSWAPFRSLGAWYLWRLADDRK